MPLLRVIFFLKRAELSVSVVRIRAEIWVPLEETRRLMDTILEKHCKIAKKSKGYAKVI